MKDGNYSAIFGSVNVELRRTRRQLDVEKTKRRADLFFLVTTVIAEFDMPKSYNAR